MRRSFFHRIWTSDITRTHNSCHGRQCRCCYTIMRAKPSYVHNKKLISACRGIDALNGNLSCSASMTSRAGHPPYVRTYPNFRRISLRRRRRTNPFSFPIDVRSRRRTLPSVFISLANAHKIRLAWYSRLRLARSGHAQRSCPCPRPVPGLPRRNRHRGCKLGVCLGL